MSDSYSDGFHHGILVGISIAMLVVLVKKQEQNKEWQQWTESHCEKIGKNFKCDDGNIYIIK
ncbi:hypothetical protein NKN67_003773 [Escherichia coli]|nr:hypothetical protein [Escherichia coli]